MRIRLSTRVRLALLHTGLVLVAGLALTALTYALVRHSLATGPRMLALTPSGQRSAAPINPATADALLHQAHAQTLRELLAQSGIALGVVVGLASVLGWLLAGRVLRPIRAISATTRRLSVQNLAERVPVPPPPDELATLAGTINAMLDRLQAGVAEHDRLLAGQRMFVANAAHELRTPLATMRTAIDVTLDGAPDVEELRAMAADISTAVEHSRHTLDGLLALAYSQIGPTRREEVDLATVAAAVLDRTTPNTVRVQRDLVYAPVRGDPVLLERTVANLVDNALRYNRPDGSLLLATGISGGRTFLRVANTGERVTTQQTARLWDPFVRGNRGGTGLGLSIVRAVAQAHGGDVDATPGAGGGLVVTVTLPRDGGGRPSTVDSRPPRW